MSALVVLPADPEQVCSIARALEVVGERWTLLILRDARLGLRRFDEFQESLGIASNVLASRLKLLSDEGVLERRPDPERPGRPEYVLTDKGRALGPALITLMNWGDRYYPTPSGPPRLTMHAGCGGRGRPGSAMQALPQARRLQRPRADRRTGPGQLILVGYHRLSMDEPAQHGRDRRPRSRRQGALVRRRLA